MSDPNLFPAGWATRQAINASDRLLGVASDGTPLQIDPALIEGAPGAPGAPGATGPSGAITAKNSGTQTNNSNATPTDIAGLAIPVVNGRRYMVRALVPHQSAATTTGIGFTWSGPSMTSAVWGVQIQQGAAGTDQQFTSVATALGTVLVSASAIAQNTTYLAVIDGVFLAAADGTLQLRFRSEVNGSQVSVLNGAALSAVDCG